MRTDILVRTVAPTQTAWAAENILIDPFWFLVFLQAELNFYVNAMVPFVRRWQLRMQEQHARASCKCPF
jgi:hypothetical protein